MADVELLPCGECGMPCRPDEYHPFAACLMFKACHNSETVRANMEPLRAEVELWRHKAATHKYRREQLAEALRELEERAQRDEALLRQALEALELRCGTHADERKELIPALRERLGVKA